MTTVAAPPRRPLEKLQATIARYIVLSEQQRLVVALWIVHTYFVPSLEQTPYLSITSPEKGCGKTRLLEILELLVWKPWFTFDASAPTLYRKIHSEMPTLLLDETDAIFGPKASERQEALRAIINCGHRRGARVDRAANFGNTLESFEVYSAKALAGIGTLPDTIADRSIPIRLQRKTRDEPTAAFRRRAVLAETAPIREGLEKFAIENMDLIAAARPALPEELSDRMQEGCEPLLAIADVLGYGVEARAALVDLLTSDRVDSEETWRTKLLSDLREIFMSRPDAHAIHTVNLVLALHLKGWDEYGHGLGGLQIAKLLRQYEIGPKNVRVGDDVAKGYHRDQFVDAWARYLPEYQLEVEGIAAPRKTEPGEIACRSGRTNSSG